MTIDLKDHAIILTDEKFIKILSENPEARSLCFKGTDYSNLTPKAFEYLNNTNVYMLLFNYPGCYKGYESLLGLERANKITFLDFCGNWDVSNDFLKTLGNMPQLKTLYLVGCRIGDGIKYLKNLKKLERFYLSKTKIRDTDLQIVPQLPELGVLDLGNNVITNMGLGFLANHPNLEDVDIESTDVTDEGFAIFPTIPKLEYLYFEYCFKLTDACIDTLYTCEKLGNIYFTGDFAYDSGLFNVYFKGRWEEGEVDWCQ